MLGRTSVFRVRDCAKLCWTGLAEMRKVMRKVMREVEAEGTPVALAGIVSKARLTRRSTR